MADTQDTPEPSTDEARFVVTYFADGKVLYQDLYAPTVPAIGMGVHFGAKAYRVEDVWINYEKHAPVDWGVVVFLKHAELGAGFFEVDAKYYAPSAEQVTNWGDVL